MWYIQNKLKRRNDSLIFVFHLNYPNTPLFSIFILFLFSPHHKPHRSISHDRGGRWGYRKCPHTKKRLYYIISLQISTKEEKCWAINLKPILIQVQWVHCTVHTTKPFPVQLLFNTTPQIRRRRRRLLIIRRPTRQNNPNKRSRCRIWYRLKTRTRPSRSRRLNTVNRPCKILNPLRR